MLWVASSMEHGIQSSVYVYIGNGLDVDTCIEHGTRWRILWNTTRHAIELILVLCVAMGILKATS